MPNFLVGAAGTAQTQNIRVSPLQTLFDLFQRHVAADGPLAVITGQNILLLLLLVHVRQLLFGTKTRIRFALKHQLFGHGLVDFGALTLPVRTVVAFLLGFGHHSLIGMQSELLQTLNG